MANGRLFDQPAKLEATKVGRPASNDRLFGSQSEGGQAQGQGLGIGQLIGLGLEGFAAGFAGRQPQGPAILQRGRLLQQRQQQLDRQAKLQKLESLPKLLEGMKFVQKSIDAEKRKQFAPFFAEGLRDFAGLNVDEETVGEMLENPQTLDGLTTLVPLIGALPKEEQLKVAEMVENKQVKIEDLNSQLSFAFAQKAKEAGVPIPTALKRNLTDQNLIDLGEEPRSVTEAKLKAEAVPAKPPSVGTDREATASAMFGKQFSELTQPQQSQVNKEIDRRKVQVSASQGALAARTKAQAEEEIRRSRPVPTDVSRLLGRREPLTVGEAEAEGLSIPEPKVRQELNEAKGFTQSAIEGATKAQNLIIQRPESFGASGALGQIVNGISAQARNFASIAGIKVTASTDPKSFKDTFAELGIKNAQIQSQLIGLAFAAAISTGQSGRSISDRDIELLLKRIGGGTQSPATAVQVLEDFKRELDSNFSRRIETTIGKGPPSLLDDKATQTARQQLEIGINNGQITKASEAIGFLTSQGVNRTAAESIVKEMLSR